MPMPLSAAHIARSTVVLLTMSAALSSFVASQPSAAATTKRTASAAAEPSAGVAKRTVIEFYARNSAGQISCAIYDGYLGGPPSAFCESYAPDRQSVTKLNLAGEVVTCVSRNDECGLGNAGVDTPTYGYGRSVTVGHFRCVVTRKGVRCVVRATGEGFLFNPRKTVGVGGATMRTSSR